MENEVQIEPSLSPTEIHDEGTKVNISCSFDANPPAQLSLMYRDGKTFGQFSQQFLSGDKFLESVALTRQNNGISYFCRAESQSQQYILYSGDITFTLTRMY